MRHIILYSLLFWNTALLAQVRGVVTDTKGEPLPFASVYVQGTTNGTTTNFDGEFDLSLVPGTYHLVFQYIGYRQKIEVIELKGKPLRLQVALEAEAMSLVEVEVRANAEDPAYAIMRKAIAKREYYNGQVQEFACDVYIKGNVKVLDAPTKILGQEVGDMDGNLDTARQGIVYLSESVSKLYCRQPDKFKEVMVSSKVSGNDNGFSFNSAQDMNINLYRNFSEFGRNVISPIAEGAMGYYRYRLEGAMIDEEGHLINKISVLPKRKEDPVYQGVIYIVDSLWNIQSADLFVTGASAAMPIFDTMFIRQTFVPVQKPDVWRLFSQTFSLSGGLFGFKFGGSFTGIYKGYDLAPNLPANFFGNEILKVEKGANEKDSTYWNAARPVPLTSEEATDYVVKDSIREIRESKPFMDSLDRKNNKIKFGSLLFGYTWDNSWKRYSFSLESPINTIQYNAVQGFNIYSGIGFKKTFDKERTRSMELKGKVSYGFSEEKFRASGAFTYNFNKKDFTRISLGGGREAVQFNELNPISTLLNTSYSLFGHKNYIRLYDKTFFNFQFRREIANGVMLFVLGQWSKRSPLANNSEYSFFKKDRIYAENVPINDHIDDGDLEESHATVLGASFRLRLKQKYFDYPDQKYIIGSKYPDIWIHYRKGVPGLLNGDADYDRLSIALRKTDIGLGLGGVSSISVEAGKFLTNKQLYFQDFRHFLGNETRVGNPADYLNAFKMLPYYRNSTPDSWFTAYYDHNFRGFLTDKIPGFKKLGWSLVAGANFLYTPEEKTYGEVSLGFDNVGFGVFRLLRFDVVASFDDGNYQGLGYMIGISVPPVGELSF